MASDAATTTAVGTRCAEAIAAANLGDRVELLSGPRDEDGGGLDLRMLSVASQVETTTTPRTATGTAGATRD